MNPAILLIGALLLIYAGATGRAEAVFKALVDPVSKTGSTGGSKVSASGGGVNPTTKSAPTTTSNPGSVGGGSLVAK